MKKEERIRRASLLCCHFTRNLAYYRAGWQNNDLINKTESWKTINSNFIDIAILEWCKLFGDYNKEKHHWKNTVQCKSKFKTDMLKHIGITPREFHILWKQVRHYRDKFVAHLDSDTMMNIPLMEHTCSLGRASHDPGLKNSWVISSKQPRLHI